MTDKPKVHIKQDKSGGWRKGNGQFIKPPTKPPAK